MDENVERKTKSKSGMLEFLCAKSLYNISMDLKNINRFVSDACLTLTRTLLKQIEVPDITVHSEKLQHSSTVKNEVKEMIDKVKKESDAS